MSDLRFPGFPRFPGFQTENRPDLGFPFPALYIGAGNRETTPGCPRRETKAHPHHQPPGRSPSYGTH